MQDYIQILKVKPRDGGRDVHRFTTAIVHLYVRAESADEVSKTMLDYLHRQEWEILEVRKSGLIDTRQIPNSDAVCKCLDQLGYCGDIHYGQPPDDISFSKS